MDFFKEGLGQFAKDIQSELMYFTNFGMRKKKPLMTPKIVARFIKQ